MPELSTSLAKIPLDLKSFIKLEMDAGGPDTVTLLGEFSQLGKMSSGTHSEASSHERPEKQNEPTKKIRCFKRSIRNSFWCFLLKLSIEKCKMLSSTFGVIDAPQPVTRNTIIEQFKKRATKLIFKKLYPKRFG